MESLNFIFFVLCLHARENLLYLLFGLILLKGFRISWPFQIHSISDFLCLIQKQVTDCWSGTSWCHIWSSSKTFNKLEKVVCCSRNQSNKSKKSIKWPTRPGPVLSIVTDIQLTLCVKIMTTYSVRVWWVNIKITFLC